MEEYLNTLVSNFEGKEYKNFLAYVYYKIQKEIDAAGSKRDKNKYIKIRKSIISYILSNPRTITLELLKKKLTK